MSERKNTIYREMVTDLLYRLRLGGGPACQATDAVMSSMSLGDSNGKQEAVDLVRAYAKSLQVIYADFLHVVERQHLVFPAEVSLWQWNEPNGEETIAKTVERLNVIADGMEMKLNAEMVKMEVSK